MVSPYRVISFFRGVMCGPFVNNASLIENSEL
jgi:hypothetical protein